MQAAVNCKGRVRLVGERVWPFMVRNALLIALIATAIVFGAMSEYFWTIANLRSVALQSSILGIVAVAGGLVTRRVPRPCRWIGSRVRGCHRGRPDGPAGVDPVVAVPIA